jgi:hypothetical protein
VAMWSCVSLIDIGIPLQHGDTALMLACWGGHLDLVKWLVSGGHSDPTVERKKVVHVKCHYSGGVSTLIAVALMWGSERQHGAVGGVLCWQSGRCEVAGGSRWL